jgi:hypothetical protein
VCSVYFSHVCVPFILEPNPVPGSCVPWQSLLSKYPSTESGPQPLLVTSNPSSLPLWDSTLKTLNGMIVFVGVWFFDLSPIGSLIPGTRGTSIQNPSLYPVSARSSAGHGTLRCGPTSPKASPSSLRGRWPSCFACTLFSPLVSVPATAETEREAPACPTGWATNGHATKQR